MTVDTTLAFAARRNVPVRYDRELVQKTLIGMERIEQIRRRRERAFYKERMKGNKERQREADRKLVEENQHLLPPHARTVLATSTSVEQGQMGVEPMQTEEQTKERIPIPVKAPGVKRKQKQKQVLVRGGGPERMDVDDE